MVLQRRPNEKPTFPLPPLLLSKMERPTGGGSLDQLASPRRGQRLRPSSHSNTNERNKTEPGKGSQPFPCLWVPAIYFGATVFKPWIFPPRPSLVFQHFILRNDAVAIRHGRAYKYTAVYGSGLSSSQLLVGMLGAPFCKSCSACAPREINGKSGA